jgi:hypothetical protein
MQKRLSFSLILLMSLVFSSTASAQTFIQRVSHSFSLRKKSNDETKANTIGRVRIDVLDLNRPVDSQDDQQVFVSQQESSPVHAEFSGMFADSLIAPAGMQVVSSEGTWGRLDPTNPLDRELASVVGFAKIASVGFDCVPDCSPNHVGSYNANGETIEHIIAPREELIELAFSQDIGNAWYRLRDDTVAVFNPQNLLTLAIAGGGALVLRNEADDQVRRHTAKHAKRWGKGSDFLGAIGDVGVQVPVLLGMYYMSLRKQDDELHDFSTTMLSAFTINGLSTLAIKVAADTDRPSDRYNDGRFGFPSYHTSSSFTIASVIDEYYGSEYGVPAYLVAGLIGWSRIDSRDHDLSDVLFGSALGYVIGKSVARHHLCGDSRVQILPWFEPSNGTAGVSFMREF